MTTKTYTIDRLQAGQEVAIPNCTTTGRVISRAIDGQYVVAWGGRELTLPRSRLAVWHFGQWRTGPFNATETK